MNVLKELCSVPTAPFAEQYVVRFVKEFVKKRRRLRLSEDEFGNLLIELPSQTNTKQPRWIFTAHMDHPGFVAEEMADDRTLLAAFRGFVIDEFVLGAKVRFFDNGREIPGKVVGIRLDKNGRDNVPVGATVRVNAPVSAGAPGMFDLGEGRIKNGKFYSRVCDDLAGAAACLAMIDELLKKPADVPIAVLLTRAEEEAFIGAMAAVTKPSLLKKSDRVIAIECSAAQPYAPQGDGVVIRVGDRTSVFNSDLTYFITTQAEALAKTVKTFKHQRALMPGGTCEATVYDVYGYIAASICVPLGNYHNMNRKSMKLEAEYVDVADWKNMVKLFVRIARAGHEWKPGHLLLKKKLEERFNRLRKFLA